MAKVIQQDSAQRLKQLIDNARRVVITCHLSPDGDALGSSLALAHVLRAMGKEVAAVTPDESTKSLSFLPGFDTLLAYSRYSSAVTRALRDADLIFSLDYNSPKRVSHVEPFLRQAAGAKVMIDHHLEPEMFADITVSHPEMSATCLVLYYLLCDLGWRCHITPAVAECLLTGILTDTGNLVYNIPDPEVFEVVADLIRLGADKQKLNKLLFNTFSESCLRINGYALSEKMKVYPDMHAALITLTRDELNRFHYSKGDTEGLVNKPLAIPGVVYSAFLREEDDYVKVSMRSEGDFPVDKLCSEYFGGGGHRNAAGGEFDGTMEQCVAVFESILDENRRRYID